MICKTVDRDTWIRASVMRTLRRAKNAWRARGLPNCHIPLQEHAELASTIFCIGDSHVSLFGGLDLIQPIWPRPSIDILRKFRTYHVGPALAYNLSVKGTTALGHERIMSILTFLPKNAQILFCFGEIDCRAHILKAAQKGIGDAIERCVDRYLKMVFSIKGKGFRLMIYNVVPSTPFKNAELGNYPTLGTCQERNEITRKFNALLHSRCKVMQVPFVETFSHFVKSDGETDPVWMMDPVHLQQKALPLTTAAISSAMAS